MTKPTREQLDRAHTEAQEVLNRVMNPQRSSEVKRRAKENRKKSGSRRGQNMLGRPPVFDHALIVQQYQEGNSTQTIARLHGCHRGTVLAILKEAGIKPKRGRRSND